MNRAVTCLALCVIGSACATAAAQTLPAAERDRILQAMPARAATQPASPRKLLVVTADPEARHKPVQPHLAMAVTLLGEKTGAFAATLTDDVAALEPDALKAFDAVCFANTSGEPFLPKEFPQLPEDQQAQLKAREARLKASLLAFLGGGKGFVGIHGAADTLRSWPAYGSMLGGTLDTTPWPATAKVTLRVEDPTLCRGFANDLAITGPIPQIGSPYYRLFQRPILTIDNRTLDPKASGPNRADGDYAVSWVKKNAKGSIGSTGKGRVFYTALGGHADHYRDTRVLTHLLDGIQFAIGDLQAPTETIPSLADEDRIRAALPKKLAAQPSGKRKVLVFARYGHTYGHYVARALEIAGKETGAFEAVVSDDLNVFAADRLKEFDAVFLNHATLSYKQPSNPRALPVKTEAMTIQHASENLEAYVKAGKGLVGIHASAGGGPELTRMLAPGASGGHPWYQDVTLKFDDPASPLNKGLPAEGFVVHDEYYAFLEAYPADVRTLLSIDLKKTVRQTPADPKHWLNSPGHTPARTDGHYAIAWIRRYGEGRVCWSSFGHHYSVVFNPAVLQHYINAVQFAVGDLPADTTPNVPPAATASRPAKETSHGQP